MGSRNKESMRCIKQVIDDWDPIDLHSCAPDDEYIPEIEEIQNLLCRTKNLDELAGGIFAVFMESFGEESFNKSKMECRQIAQRLLFNNKS